MEFQGLVYSTEVSWMWTLVIYPLVDFLQLGKVSPHSGATYQFIDRNGWPVRPEQEDALSVTDLLQENCVKIKVSSPVNQPLPLHDIADGHSPHRQGIQSSYMDNQG